MHAPRWGAALAAAIVLAATTGGVVLVAEPRLAVSGLMSGTEMWSLAVFTEAVLALLGGLAAWIGGWAGSRGVRDVALNAELLETQPSGVGNGSKGLSLVTRLGVCLLMVYTVGWIITSG